MKVKTYKYEAAKSQKVYCSVAVVDEHHFLGLGARQSFHICVTNEPVAKLIAAALESLIATEDGRALVVAAEKEYWNQRKEP